jgi:glycosyltransferase involved in cell wall biosynthesis
MTIGIDTFDCNGGRTGVGLYLCRILRHFKTAGLHLELFGWDYDRFAYGDYIEEGGFIPQCSINGPRANTLWHVAKYPGFARERGYTACFFPSAHRTLPWNSPCPSIGTVHDLSSLSRGPGRRREKLGTVLRMVLPNSLRRLDKVIAVSQWIREELIDVVKVKEQRIEVIPNGVDLGAFYPRPRDDESVVLIQPFSFRRPYILYVSRIDHPVKNHVRLIKAFEIFKDSTHFPHRLVLAGGDSRHAETVKRRAAASPYRNDIFFTGYFPLKNLPELYSGADFVVFPSMYEGFGMGVLEAMASGVPVACARAASLPEVADNAALYFDPLSPEDMADRMVTITTDRAMYRECAKLGLERAQLYGWDNCAQKTLALIRQTTGEEALTMQ